jgi:DNA-binding transcriptional ArsR family regulator
MDQSGPFRSARDYFHRHLNNKKAGLAKRVKLAEHVNDWFKKAWFENDTGFSDLVDVENHLAHLAAVTVLFVESAGSIAELGAFAASDVLQEKLLAVVNESHPDDSFIADGPIRRLKNYDAARVRYDNWNDREPDSRDARRAFLRIAKDVILFVENLDAARPKQPEFKKDNTGHTLLFVADLIWLQGAVSRSEVVEVLAAVGCNSSHDNVRRHLSILQSVGFIEKRRRGDEVFYVPLLAEPFLGYAYTNDAVLKEVVKIKQATRESLERGGRRRSIVTSMLKAASNG